MRYLWLINCMKGCFTIVFIGHKMINPHLLGVKELKCNTVNLLIDKIN